MLSREETSWQVPMILCCDREEGSHITPVQARCRLVKAIMRLEATWFQGTPSSDRDWGNQKIVLRLFLSQKAFLTTYSGQGLDTLAIAMGAKSL